MSLRSGGPQAGFLQSGYDPSGQYSSVADYLRALLGGGRGVGYGGGQGYGGGGGYHADFGQGFDDTPSPVAQMIGGYNNFANTLGGAMNQIGAITSANAQHENYNNYLDAAYGLQSRTELERTKMNNDAMLQALGMKMSRYDNTVPVIARMIGGHY